jgi:hypothetical protein
MKNKISITLTDIDDVNKVLESLDILFRQILEHYIDKGNMKAFSTFIVTVSVYCGRILRLMGYTEKDFLDE